jgi:hypothetical protein
MVLTVSFGLSPVIGLVCHRHLRFWRRLDAGVEASGPHDFAVRLQRRSSCDAAASIASRSNVRDVRNAPLSGRDGGSCKFDLPDGESEIFFQLGLDTMFAEQPDGQISRPAVPSPLVGEGGFAKRRRVRVSLRRCGERRPKAADGHLLAQGEKGKKAQRSGQSPLGGASGCTISWNGGSASQCAACADSAG